MITCKKCGGTYFYRNYPVRGTWQELVKSTDIGLVVEESFTDDLKQGGEPKTIICADCKTRHYNPDYQK